MFRDEILYNTYAGEQRYYSRIFKNNNEPTDEQAEILFEGKIDKKYIYKINLGEFNPQIEDYIYQSEFKLDVDKMIERINKDNINLVLFSNPCNPTGQGITADKVRKLVNSVNALVVLDEAYMDFGAESCVPLIHKYKNLLVTGTFSKSRSMAGARLGFGVACRELISDLNTIKYSTNPYNINSMTMAAGIGQLEDEAITRQNCRTIMENRAYVARELEQLGFILTDSKTNFVFAAHEAVSGEEIYLKLKERGILVRHFSTPRIAQYNRITVGSREQMDALIQALKEILEEKQ
jgi:histidinol-phosphate aminotransferase